MIVRTLLTDFNGAFQNDSATYDHPQCSAAAAAHDAGVTLQCAFGIEHISTA